MRIVWEYFGHMRAWDGMRRYVRLDLGRREQPESPDDDVITIGDARFLVARSQGFENWQALETFTTPLPPKTTLAERLVAAFTRVGTRRVNHCARGTGTRSWTPCTSAG